MISNNRERKGNNKKSKGKKCNNSMSRRRKWKTKKTVKIRKAIRCQFKNSNKK